jgi:hypothetical protein
MCSIPTVPSFILPNSPSRVYVCDFCDFGGPTLFPTLTSAVAHPSSQKAHFARACTDGFCALACAAGLYGAMQKEGTAISAEEALHTHSSDETDDDDVPGRASPPTSSSGWGGSHGREAEALRRRHPLLMQQRTLSGAWMGGSDEEAIRSNSTGLQIFFLSRQAAPNGLRWEAGDREEGSGGVKWGAATF